MNSTNIVNSVKVNNVAEQNQALKNQIELADQAFIQHGKILALLNVFLHSNLHQISKVHLYNFFAAVIDITEDSEKVIENLLNILIKYQENQVNAKS